MGRIHLFINEFFLNEPTSVYRYFDKSDEPIAIISKELFSINIYSLKMKLELQDLKEIFKYFKIKKSKEFSYKKIYEKYNSHLTIRLKIQTKLALMNISLPIIYRNQISSVEYTTIDVNDKNKDLSKPYVYSESEINNKIPIDYIRYLNNYFIIYELFKIIQIDETIGMNILSNYGQLKLFFCRYNSSDNLINSNMKKDVLNNLELVTIKNIYKQFPEDFEFGKSLAKMVLELIKYKFENYNDLYEMKNNSLFVLVKIIN